MTNPMVLPCPFCGGPAGQARWPNHYGCINTECGAYLANLTLEKWNSRADATPEMARVRAIAARIIDARERDHWNDLDEAVDDLLGGSKPPENEPKVGETFPEGVLPDARLIRSTLFQQFMRQGFWHAHHVDLVWRMDGKDIREEADWLKDVWYALRGSAAAERASRDASSGDTSVALDGGPICEDCPPLGYPTDKTRCDECPRHSERTSEQL